MFIRVFQFSLVAAEIQIWILCQHLGLSDLEPRT